MSGHGKLRPDTIGTLADEQRDTLTSSEDSILTSIAYQTALEGGEAVYEARALLKLDIIDEFDENLRRAFPAHHASTTPQNKTLAKIYPNPGSGLFTVESNLETDSKVELSLFDMSGQVLQLIAISGQSKLQLDCRGYENGCYYFRIKSEGRPVQLGKLVLIK